MRPLELRTATGRCIARRVHMACSFRSRCTGLLRRRSMPEDEGLLLMPGSSVHTLGMRFNIDVVFLSRQMRVLALAENVTPWRIVIAPKGTARVLEFAAGKIAATQLAVGIYLIVDRPSDDPSERSTRKLPRGGYLQCDRTSIQFSLRLPRQCEEPRTPRPCRPEPVARATMKPSVES